ncbi:hypothetical protein Sango_0667300 [Sesamum angolense]|uniref:Ty3-gypsy retrotransposon protein n=1 Tax=Sesamum angolense TaxID=2727404 RepID=A0AAE2C2J7_9LAMI|nr:hypothetical protein Sango_0667300 [Sesamum angolense]
MSNKACLAVTFHETIEKDVLYLSKSNEDDGDLKNDSSLSTPRSTSSVAPIIVTSTTILKEQIANLTRTIEGLAKERSSTNELKVSSEGLIPVDQLKEFIMGTIKNKLGGSSKSSMTYTKPYTQRIDNLKMSFGYQPPKFQQFDSNGNPKQHMAHFTGTCENAGTFMEITL